METSDVIALFAVLIAGCSLAFTWKNHALAREAEKRAIASEMRSEASELRSIEAFEKAEKQERRGYWNRPIEAFGRLVTCHAMDEKAQDRLADCRLALMSLLDHVSEEEYPGIGDYIPLTHGITALHYEKSLLAMKGKPKTIETISEAHEPIVQWLSACISNLRVLQNSENSEDLRAALGRSLQNYRDVYRQLKGSEYKRMDLGAEV